MGSTYYATQEKLPTEIKVVWKFTEELKAFVSKIGIKDNFIKYKK